MKECSVENLLIGIEPISPESESDVLTITPYNHFERFLLWTDRQIWLYKALQNKIVKHNEPHAKLDHDIYLK